MAKRLLLVAFHMPPVQESSGVHRTLAFSRYLHGHGWDVCVLTARPSAYIRVREANLKLIAPHARVVRAWGLNTTTQLALRGRYLRIMAIPDQWQSWILGGTIAGMREVLQWRPQALMSTYPLASAHAIGLALHRFSGLPWVADFRDPMAQTEHPADALVRRSYRWLEERVFRHAARVTVTTQGASTAYAHKYPAFPSSAIRVIENGYDEGVFPEAGVAPQAPAAGRRLLLLHSGLLYSAERNPEQFFAAVGELRDSGALQSRAIEIRLRAPGHLQQYSEHVASLGLGELVTVLPPVDYQAAVEEMLGADGLLIFQASMCNAQIPAKAYEYLYAGRPILALTDPAGDTAGLLRATGVESIVRLDDKEDIKRGLMAFVTALRDGSLRVPTRDEVARLSRRARTAELAALLDELV